jgi:hypothetical protein
MQGGMYANESKENVTRIKQLFSQNKKPQGSRLNEVMMQMEMMDDDNDDDSERLNQEELQKSIQVEITQGKSRGSGKL